VGRRRGKGKDADGRGLRYITYEAIYHKLKCTTFQRGLQGTAEREKSRCGGTGDGEAGLQVLQHTCGLQGTNRSARTGLTLAVLGSSALSFSKYPEHS
jgi:hypothetical protein